MAGYTGWGHAELMEMELQELIFWAKESVKMHNYLNGNDGG